MAEYIEREALLAEMRVSGKAAYLVVMDAPAADVVPVRHGRWEEQDYDWSEAWKCSACGEEWCFEYDPTEPTTRVNYCPNCGARMDGE